MQAAPSSSPSSVEDEPLRLLLVRSRPGELPWLATMLARTMAPAEITQVIGFANAIWRLDGGGFDTVLLDIELRDPEAIACCREQIAEVAAIPVLNLRDPVEAGTVEERPQPEPAPRPGASRRRTPRTPWQRRPRRQQPSPEAGVASAG